MRRWCVCVSVGGGGGTFQETAWFVDLSMSYSTFYILQEECVIH